MTNDGSQLKYLGTQSHETMAMEAALARQAELDTEAIHADKLGRRRVRVDSAGEEAVGGTISGVAEWAVEKAKSAPRVAAHQLGAHAGVAFQRYVSRDPLRVSLIAAVIGAVAMASAVIVARSFLRRVTAR